MMTLKILNRPVLFVDKGSYRFVGYKPTDIFNLVKGSFLWDEPASYREQEFEIYEKTKKPYVYTVVGTQRYIFEIRQQRELQKYIKIIRKTITKLRELDRDLSRLFKLYNFREVFYEGNYFPEILSNTTITDKNVSVYINVENLLLQKFLEQENLDYIKGPDDLTKIKVIWENYEKLHETRLSNFLARKDQEDTTPSIEDIIMAQYAGS